MEDAPFCHHQIGGSDWPDVDGFRSVTEHWITAKLAILCEEKELLVNHVMLSTKWQVIRLVKIPSRCHEIETQ